MDSIEPSIIGLIIQTAGIVLIAILCSLLYRSIRRRALFYWTIAWTCLCLSLGALFVAFLLPSIALLCLWVYLLGEYAFAFLCFAGCRNFATGHELGRSSLWLLVPGGFMAFFLPRISQASVDILFIPHSALLAYLFILSYRALHPAHKSWSPTPGIRVMSVALILLTVQFLHYIPLFSYSALRDISIPLTYLQYSSLYDLVLEVFLGFGIVMVTMEGVSRDLEFSNRELTDARDRLEELVSRDPLTNALNRRAFYEFVERARQAYSVPISGCAALVDLDELKRVNDLYGHSAGDEAIRAVARAIRSIIRADDLLFRWGGDEFLVLLIGLPEAEGRKRFEGLNAALKEVELPEAGGPVPISVSCGVTAFQSDEELHEAVAKADSAMYTDKQSRKVGTNGTPTGE